MINYFKNKKQKEKLLAQRISQLEKDNEYKIEKWISVLDDGVIQKLRMEHTYNKYKDCVFTNVVAHIQTYEDREMLYPKGWNSVPENIQATFWVIETEDYNNYNLKKGKDKFRCGEISVNSYADLILSSKQGDWARKLIVEAYEKRGEYK